MRIHPGQVIHAMDHYVMAIRNEQQRSAAFFSLYSLAYMPEVGAGHCCFLRIRTADGTGDVDLAFSETPEIGAAMRRRLQAMVPVANPHGGLGVDLDIEPELATFHRLPGPSDRFRYRVVADDHEICASWFDPEVPVWFAAPRGSFHEGRDLLGTIISCRGTALTVDGARVAGDAYADEAWEERLDRAFSSSHVALGEAALSPARGWWG